MDAKLQPINFSSSAVDDLNLAKKIKKNIYGKLQTVKIVIPAGFNVVAVDEIQAILNNLWFSQPSIGEITYSQNEVYIRNIHMFAVVELLIRSTCLTDIRLVLAQSKTRGKQAFQKKCNDTPWRYYLSKKMRLKLRINSVASKAFHESALKDILSDIVKPYVTDVVSGEDVCETTCLYADLYKDKLTLSISLAGEPLYKRGYRGILKASAPLREDAAANCIRNALQFYNKFVANSSSPSTVVIPFSGTGTFAFEYLQYYYHIAPVFFKRKYALQEMPCHKPENFQYLSKKAVNNCTFHEDTALPTIICIDKSAAANSALLENIESFNEKIVNSGFQYNKPNLINNDFFKMDLSFILKAIDIQQDIFMPLNPPYGIRLNKQSNSVLLYKSIAAKLNEIAQMIKGHVCGFILCPNEESWSSFIKNLKQAETETYHFTQGGIDIRVCQFYI